MVYTVTTGRAHCLLMEYSFKDLKAILILNKFTKTSKANVDLPAAGLAVTMS